MFPGPDYPLTKRELTWIDRTAIVAGVVIGIMFVVGLFI